MIYLFLSSSVVAGCMGILLSKAGDASGEENEDEENDVAEGSDSDSEQVSEDREYNINVYPPGDNNTHKQQLKTAGEGDESNPFLQRSRANTASDLNASLPIGPSFGSLASIT